ncbi:predicted protein [Uncinocarpus reesii 1704]|uniref:Uncharacterized protein n=1 Tax=Uncinocarpus reesii (strain UAMH 1704) TaxID=336963 RepID=C4JFK7_UNCRE|nr:uncharacterized protein UREG_01021 [Uncinocarpus reesii 1704]EEP76172.1 predicted protein [Uncinocarpus reesii 1704]
MTVSKAQTLPVAGASTDILLEAQDPTGEPCSTGNLVPYPAYSDLENDDSPPAYVEHDESLPLVNDHDNLPNELALSNLYEIPGGRVLTSKREGKTYTVSLAPYLSSNAEVLYKFFKLQADIPPLICFSVKGTHTVSRRNSDRQRSSETVTDFDFLIDGSGILAAPRYARDGYHRVTKVIKDNDGVSAYRGGRFKSTRSGWVTNENTENSLESGDQATNGPTLEEWCQRFCNDKSGVRSFTLHRDIVSWNLNIIQQEIKSIIRSTNYRGSLSVSPFIKQSRLTIYSPSFFNKMRTNNLVWWACVILQLWILAWPLLILLERRYEIIRVEHRPPDFPTETEWIRRFAPAIKAAALGRRKGETVTTVDITRGADMLAGRDDTHAERERRQRMDRGEATWADSVVGVVRGVSEVARHWDTSLGWGGDE